MDKIEKIRQEIERRIEAIAKAPSDNGVMDSINGARGHELMRLLSFLDTLSEEPDKGLEEAAETHVKNKYCLTKLLGAEVREAVNDFIAGAEWQKEQDQPITGNSLEQEWLRYVDRKKKEYRGDLPSLGEYGWLQIARHFAEWQKSQMPMPEDTVLFNKGVAEGRRLEREDMLKDAVEGEAVKIFEEGVASIHYNAFAIGEMAYFCKSDNIRLGQKVRIIVLKDNEDESK